MRYQYILWDWNGTIMDDVGIALDAVNHMLFQCQRSAITLEAYRRAMDTPIIHFYEQFFDMERVSFSWIAQEFNQYYGAHEKELFLHEGVLEQLKAFQRKNCQQIVLSSSSTDIIQNYAEKYDITQYFSDILGADNLLSESKIDRAVHYFREHQVELDQTVLIGDTVHDFEVAQALGVDCVLLTWGHQDRDSLAACGCPVYDTITEWKGKRV